MTAQIPTWTQSTGDMVNSIARMSHAEARSVPMLAVAVLLLVCVVVRA